MADFRKDFGGWCVPQQLGEAVYAFGGGKRGGDVGAAVHASADFDGAEYGGEGGAVVGEEVVHAFQPVVFLLGLGFELGIALRILGRQAGEAPFAFNHMADKVLQRGAGFAEGFLQAVKGVCAVVAAEGCFFVAFAVIDGFVGEILAEDGVAGERVEPVFFVVKLEIAGGQLGGGVAFFLLGGGELLRLFFAFGGAVEFFDFVTPVGAVFAVVHGELVS